MLLISQLQNTMECLSLRTRKDCSALNAVGSSPVQTIFQLHSSCWVATYCNYCADLRVSYGYSLTDFNTLQLKWSLFLPHSGHYMYRTVVTVCTAQWSLYAPHSGHCMYRTVVTICTAQWSLYVPHSGHYMYRTVVTVCTAQWSLYAPQWSLYVPHSGHYMHREVVTICTAQWSLYVP